MVISMVTVGFAGIAGTAVANVDGTIDEDDYDRNITPGQAVFQGQIVLIQLPADHENSWWELRRVDEGEVGGLVSTPMIVDATFSSKVYAIIDTQNRDPDDYILSNASRGTSLNDISDDPETEDYYGVHFENFVQDLDVEFDEDDVANVEDNSEIDLNIQSNIRNNYAVTVSADGLDEQELKNIFTSDDQWNLETEQTDRSEVQANHDNSSLYFVDEDQESITLFGAEGDAEITFEDIEPNEYDFEFEVFDSTAASTSPISVFGDVIDPDGPPLYNLTLENDGSIYSVGFPGETDGTLEDIFVNGFDGVEAVYGYDSENNQWQLFTGDDFNRDTEELEAIVVLTDGQTEPSEIDISIKFEKQAVAQPSQRTLEEGWEFTPASTFDDVDTVFDRGTADVTIALDSFATPQVNQLGTHGNFLSQQTTPYYDLESGQPPQMNPFKGYFVYVTEEGTHPSIVSGIESRQEADQALNATNIG